MALFKKRSEPVAAPTEPTDYPYGLCIRTEAGVFLIREKTRFRLPTQRVVDSWRFDVLESSESAVKHVRISGKIGFRDGTLIRNIADSKVYLISHNKKRHIQSPEVFERFRFSWDKVLLVSDEEAKLHNDGEVLN